MTASFAPIINASIQPATALPNDLQPMALSMPVPPVPGAPLRPRGGAPLLQLAPGSMANATRWQYNWRLEFESPANATLHLRVWARRVPVARFPCTFTVCVHVYFHSIIYGRMHRIPTDARRGCQCDGSGCAAQPGRGQRGHTRACRVCNRWTRGAAWCGAQRARHAPVPAAAKVPKHAARCWQEYRSANAQHDCCQLFVGQHVNELWELRVCGVSSTPAPHV